MVAEVLFFLALSEANKLAARSLKKVWNTFSYAAEKYKRKYAEIPILIIDNANKIEAKQLEQIQDLAKKASDERMATVVFVTSKGSVPRLMMERSSWSRHGRVFEISDVSEKE